LDVFRQISRQIIFIDGFVLAHDGSPSHNKKNEDPDEATVSHEDDFIKAHTIFEDK
jgi:hypothetical protein